MGILQNSNAIPSATGASGFYDHQIEQSVRLTGSDSSYLKLSSGDTSGNRVYWRMERRNN